MISPQLSKVLNPKNDKTNAKTKFEVGVLERRREEIIHAVMKG